MATETQTKLVGFCLGNKTNYNATNYANHIWFDPTNKQILLNGIEYIPKKLSELVNDKNFITSITKSMVENVLTGNITSHTHSYLPLSGGTMSNTNLVTNLNADLLDGYHAEVMVKSDIGGTDDLTKFTKRAYFKTVYTSEQGDFCSLVVPTWVGNQAENYYITELRFKIDSINPQIRTYSKDKGTSSWGSLALLTDNVASASKWANARTITLTGSVTGSVSIDGSANVSLATTTNHTHNEYLPLTGGTLTGALTCNGDYINMNNDSGSRGYRGFFNQSGTANRASGSHIFMKGGGYALGSNSVSIGYQAYAGIRNEDADKNTYPYIAWQWMPAEKFSVDTTNSSFGQTGEFYGYPLLPNEMVRWSIDGGQKVIYENSSSYKELLVVIKASDADTGLVFGGKTTLPYSASKTLIAGKYIVGAGEYLKNITEITINDVKYYQVIIYTWNATAFPTSYDFTQQVKVMCATKVNNSNYSGAASYASGIYSVASGAHSVASSYSSVASGSFSVASGAYSVASGYYSVASGYSSVASGNYSVASGNYSVVLARNGETMSSYQTIVGKFNAKVAGLFIIGNGTSDTARSNAFVVDDSGNVTAKYFSGYANAIGGEGFKIYAENNNQINFGGTASDTTIVFGAASKDNRNVPTTYKFGANGTAIIQAASFSGNAATATNADTLDGYHASSFLTATFSKTIDLNEISTPSIYMLDTENPNLPSSIFSYGNILTVKNANNDTAWQLIGSYSSDALWFRRGTWYAGGTGTLRTNAWKVIAFTDSNVATATALTSSAGSATQPIYFSNGKPVACSYTLAKSVPSNAVFTDTTYSVATASADGLMSSDMFKAQMVKSLGIKQGAEMMKPDGTITITDHSVYITQDKSNINGIYGTSSVDGGGVKIPNATKDYDGSMSYTDKRKIEAIFNDSRIYNSVSEISESKMEIESGIDIGGQSEFLDYWQLPMATTSLCGLMTGTDKRKLDGISPYAPKKVVALRLSFNADATVTVISGGGDYDMTQDAGLMESKYVEQTSTNNLYLTTFSLDTVASSTNTLNNLFRNSFVKFSFMGKSSDGISNHSINVKSNFDNDTLDIQFVSTIQNDSWVVDCVWEFF